MSHIVTTWTDTHSNERISVAMILPSGINPGKKKFTIAGIGRRPMVGSQGKGGCCTYGRLPVLPFIFNEKTVQHPPSRLRLPWQGMFTQKNCV